jgi:hypothetical protein
MKTNNRKTTEPTVAAKSAAQSSGKPVYHEAQGPSTIVALPFQMSEKYVKETPYESGSESVKFGFLDINK